jgi:deoxyribose-phosphate aldolase
MPTAANSLTNRAPIELAFLDERSLMGCVDHAILRPETTRAEVEAAVQVAIEWQTATVCCRPADLELVVKRLRGTGVAPSTVIGFPHGVNTSAVKEREALVAVDDGAAELDVVANIGAIRAGDLRFVRDELGSLCYAVAPTPVKVIIETAYLTTAQVEAACLAVMEARAAFVKNGTGYSPRGAEAGEIALMRATVGNAFGVKAAGGIRNLDTMLSMIAAGACRIGLSATAMIGEEWRARGEEAVATAIASRAAVSGDVRVSESEAE